MERILKKSTIQKHRRNKDRIRRKDRRSNDRADMPGTRNKQAGILSVGEERNKNKVQRRDRSSVCVGEKKTSAKDRWKEIIQIIERQVQGFRI